MCCEELLLFFYMAAIVLIENGSLKGTLTDKVWVPFYPVRTRPVMMSVFMVLTGFICLFAKSMVKL